MKYRKLTPNEVEIYNVGYRNGSRQAVIKVIEFESVEEKKIYRQGYNAGCQDRKRNNIVSNVSNVSNVCNVSNVSNVNSLDSECKVNHVSNVNSHDSTIAITNAIVDDIAVANDIAIVDANVGKKIDLTSWNVFQVLSELTPEETLEAIKEQIVPKLGAYFYTGEVTDEKLKAYIVKRKLAGWQTKHGLYVRDLGCDLANWLKNEKNTLGSVQTFDEKDITEFVESWNKFAESIKGSDYWAKCEMATADDVKDLIPIAKAKLESLIATLKTKDPKFRFITPKKSDNDIWEFAIDVFRQRRFYSDFLYNECNLTPKFFCNHIDELADPYCDLYLNDSEKHTHSPT